MAPKKGNKNALKHGFYAKRTMAEKTRDRENERMDALDEIHNLRYFAQVITDLLVNKEPENYTEMDLRCMNTLININIAIGTLLRTNVLITGKASDVEKCIEDAILSMEERWILA